MPFDVYFPHVFNIIFVRVHNKFHGNRTNSFWARASQNFGTRSCILNLCDRYNFIIVWIVLRLFIYSILIPKEVGSLWLGYKEIAKSWAAHHSDRMAGNCLHLGDIWSKSEKCHTLILMMTGLGQCTNVCKPRRVNVNSSQPSSLTAHLPNFQHL